MKHHCTLLAALLPALCATAAVPLEWTADVDRPAPASLTLLRGESAELRAALVRRGRPYDPAAESAAVYWQTNGMGAAWWSAPATCASNVLSAAWTPDMDPGASPVAVFLGARDADGAIYRAFATLRILHAPGARPNELAPPVPRIDFAAVSVTNAPWALPGDIPEPDYSAANAELVGTIRDVAPPPGDYSSVSNRAMSALQSESDPFFSTWAETNAFVVEESDPTVPAWAKAPDKPGYTAEEVGAIDAAGVTNIAAGVARTPDPALASNLVARLVSEAGASAAAAETWRIILADHQRRLDAIEDADGTDALTEAQAEQMIQTRMDSLLADIEEELGSTSGCLPIQTAACVSTAISASAAGVSADLSPLRATRFYASAEGPVSLGFASFTGCGNNPCILILERFSSVSWPSGARVETAYSSSGNPNVYAVYKLDGTICAKRIYP